MDPNDIVGLGKRTDLIAPAAGVDTARLSLSPTESLVFQRVGRGARIQDVLQSSGMMEPVAISALLSLRAKGAIVPARVDPAAAAAARVDASHLEEVDLTEEQKTEILARERDIDRQNHFEVLGLVPGAEPGQAKNAYYELSRRFHPDRFYGKNLGSFRIRVDKLFKRWTEAHQVLTQPNKRAEYLAAHPELAPTTGAGVGAGERAPEATRNQERKSRLARHPYLARAVQAHGLLHEGKAKLQEGDYANAYAKLQKAAAIDQNSGQNNGEAQVLLEQTRERYAATRFSEKMVEADRAERAGKSDEAIAAYRMAAGMDESRLAPVLKLIDLLIRNAGSMDEAYELASRAVNKHAGQADAHVALGRVVLERGGDKKTAKACFETALRLSPDHEEATKQIKKLRWTF
ncbi:MAG: DnaJ domain-containing protein [Myxococcaceae bacterium]